ncbi:cytochrome P450 [Gimesia chilikensis]|uniref:cytochrome P450 n=1 Tax=Gimesia chilikensis TaxID=2605989 RepID=UPI0011ED33AF|nr:cytochrome P450 [Gimesia chilikensis]KAA0139343.1 cytochrome P450 [Gimesia chilikensis]
MHRLKQIESTLAFIRDPYRFISRTCEQHEVDLFETRLLLQKTICLRGEDAARIFYDTDRFTRVGAAPKFAIKTLFGQKGVQGLDEEAHRHRKQMFVSILKSDQINDLTQLFAAELNAAVARWECMPEVILYAEFQRLLTIAVCHWAGVPLSESEIGLRTRQLTLLFDQAANPGLGHFRSRRARRNANQWITGLIQQIRDRQLTVGEKSPASIIAWHRDLDQQLLPPEVAAVELLNVLRPVVAVSVYLTFVAHALQQHPHSRKLLRSDFGRYALPFVQEVRRFYPFFPLTAARVRKYFEWQGHAFPRGRRVLLDLYGTNHDRRIWNKPEHFEPERFLQHNVSPFDFIPQGGGDVRSGHRCPGEDVAVNLMLRTAEFLIREVQYEVPRQNLELDFSRMPALPESRFRISAIRNTEDSQSCGLTSEARKIRV